MNENEILIYLYSKKSNEWQDITKRVEWYGKGFDSWIVKFKGTEERYYISFSNFKVYENPREIKCLSVLYKGLPCYNFEKLILFNDMRFKIFYKNGSTIASIPDYIQVIRDSKEMCRTYGVMEYYKAVVRSTAKTEEDNFLITQFDEIDSISEDSVLSLYLNGTLGTKSSNKVTPICPFGLNMSQSKALEMALTNRISIIEGPPGTGKTQTILNIISNAVMMGKTVAVVSNNNAATNNVFEKMDKYGYSFICAPLGNRDNVDKFFEEYNSEIPELNISFKDCSNLSSLYGKVKNDFKVENDKKILKAKLDSVKLEYEHFLSDYTSFDFNQYRFSKKVNDPELVQWALIRFKEKEKIRFSDRLAIKRLIKVKRKFYLLDRDNIIVLLQNFYYQLKIKQIENEINELNEKVNEEVINQKIKELRELSSIKFTNRLVVKYRDSDRDHYDKNNYKREFASFVKEYPVILSSTYALAKCSGRGFLFDYLIVDESSQVNMASAILSMRMAKNLIVVGDIKQLPQIDDSTFDKRNKELLEYFNIPQAYSYQGNSIMSSILALYGDKVPRQMLKEHYRCAPEIINFCNKEFYNDELVIYTKSKENYNSMKVIKTVAGNFARKNPDGSGLYNQREIDEIEALMNQEQLDDVGVITPYRYQSQLIQSELGDRVDSSTIHKFQGREKKTIIFSSVVNDVNDFVGNDNLINVAVSRAQERFILVTSDKVAHSKTGVLSDLVNYISYHQDFGTVKEGNVKSIYDILYSDYEEELKAFRERHPSKDFDTENITKEVLSQILKADKYKNIWFRMHVSLRDFLNNKVSGLSEEEYKFYLNPNSHVDFLIYNKMSRKPLAAIEVDGVSYHEQSEKQRNRDAKKNAILEKACIPLLRLKTNESEEEARIKEFIEYIINDLI